MPGVAVRFRDRAGGVQFEQKQDWFRLETPGIGGSSDPVVTVGDTVAAHGTTPHSPAPEMVEGEDWFTLDGVAVCRAGNRASCGHPTSGRYWFRLERADDGFRDYLTPASDPCNIEHIPWIMRAHGWNEGAKLMDQWFNRTASTSKLPNDADTTTIKMPFVLGFPEGLSAYNELVDTSKWTEGNDDLNRSPIDRLHSSLRTRGLLTDQPMTFNDFQKPVPSLKGTQIDSRRVGSGTLSTDGLAAALGRFELLLVVSGRVEPYPDGRAHRITVESTGVFVEDEYDFYDEPGEDQLLGYWNAEANVVGHGCEVRNSSFRQWRDLTGHGGDFMIYSDLWVVPLEQPYTFIR
jgi:hypothetical protein